MPPLPKPKITLRKAYLPFWVIQSEKAKYPASAIGFLTRYTGDIQKQKDTVLQSRSCTECNGSGQFLCLECYNQGHNRATMLLASIYVHLLEHLMYYHLSQCNYVEAHKVSYLSRHGIGSRYRWLISPFPDLDLNEGVL